MDFYFRCRHYTASLHRANTIAAIATMYLDAQYDTEGRNVLAEAVTAAADIGNVLERCGVLGYAAQEYARTGYDVEARVIIRQVRPQLARLAATQDSHELDELRTAAEWLAMAGTWLHDTTVTNTALSLVNDEGWRNELRQRLAHISVAR